MAIRRGNTLWWKTGMDNTGLKKGAVQAKGILRTMSQQIAGLDIFAGLGIAAVVAFAKISKKAFQMSKDFDKAMREVQTISAAAQKNFEGMSDSVKALAKSVPEDAEGLSKALYQIVSAGYDGAEGLELLEVATKGAVAGVTDTITAADGLTSVMNAWKIEAEKASEVSDDFFTTVRLGKTTFGEMANSISLVAPLAASLGVEFSEVASATASLTKQGTPTAVAMTQIRQIMISLNEHLGQGWRETYTMQEAMEKLRQIADESGKDIKEFTGRIEGAVGILGLTGDNAKIARADIEEYANSVGATADAYDLMVKAAENQIKILKSRWHDKLLEYGENLTRMFGGIAQALNDKAVIKALRDEQLEINKTVSSILELEEGTDDRKEALDELKSAYPELFENLDTEKLSNEDVLGVLELINDEYRDRITLATQAAAEGKIDRKVERAQKRVDKVLESLLAVNVRLGLPGGTIDKIVEQLSGLEPVDIGGDIFTYDAIQSQVGVLDDLQARLDRLVGKQSEIEEFGESLRKSLEPQKPMELGEIMVTPEGSYLSEEFEAQKAAEEAAREASEEELEVLRDYLDSAKEAYNEWSDYKNTSLANELKTEYDQYLTRGSTYKAFLESQLQIYEGNVQSRIIIMKELARIEYETAKEAREKIAKEEAEFYDRALKKLSSHLEKEAEQIASDIEKTFNDIDKNIAKELKGEEFDEVAKAYMRFGEVVFLTDEQLKELQEDTDLQIDLVSQLGSAIAQFGGKSSVALESIGMGIEGITGIMSGDYLGGALQLIEAIENFRVAREEQKLELDASKEQAHVDALNREVEKLNRALDEHLYLLSQLQGTDWLLGADKTLGVMNDQIDQLNANIRDTQLRFNAPKPGVKEPDQNRWTDWIAFKIGIDDLTNEEIQQKLDEYWGMLLPGPRDQIQDWLDEIASLEKEMNNIMADIQLETVGFEVSYIGDALVAEFERGKDAASDFDKVFYDIMSDSLLNIFKQQFITSQVQGFYDMLYSKLTTQNDKAAPAFGGISSGELEDLQERWEDIVTDAQTGWDLMQSWLDGLESDLGGLPEDTKEGLAGAIKGITEDTAQILAGQITAIRFNILENQEIAEDSLDALQAIEQNTSYNYLLYNINTELIAIKSRLGGIG